MIELINRVKDTLLFPKRMDGYSLIFRSMEYWPKKSEDELIKENRLPDKHPLSYLNVIGLYLVFILPFSLLLCFSSGSPEKAAISLIILLGIGILLGSIHATLGLTGVLFGIFIFAQNISIITSQIPSIKYWWAGLPVLLLPFAIYTQIASSPISKPRLGFLRFLFGIAIASAGLLATKVTFLQITSWNYYYTLLLLSLVLSAPDIHKTTKEGKVVYERKASTGIWISGTLSTLIAAVIIWEWLTVATGNMASWTKIFTYPAALLIGLIIHFSILLPPFEQESDSGPVFFANKRWMAFLFYLSFQLVVAPEIAITASIAGVILYSLSFINLNFNQNDIKRWEFTIAVTISALVWFYVTAGVFVNTDWAQFGLAFFINPAYSTPLALVTFFASAFVLTITGRHNADFAWIALGAFFIFLGSAILQGISFALILEVVLALFGLAAGTAVGYVRVLAWPWLSFVTARELRHIRSLSVLTEDRIILASSLLDINCWPTPLKRVDLAAELIKHGWDENRLLTTYSKSDLAKARKKIANEFFSSDFKIDQLMKGELGEPPEVVQKNVSILQKSVARGLPRFEKIDNYLTVIENLSSYLKKDKPTSKPSARSTDHALEMANNLLKVVTDELLLIYAERQIFDKELLEIATSIPENSDEFDIPKLEKKKKQSVVEKKRQPLDEQFTHHVQTAIKLSSSIKPLESYLDVLSNESKNTYSVILDIESNLANLRSARFDIPAQRRIIQISIQSLAEVEKSVKKKSLAFDENAHGVISLDNPWFTMVDYLSRLTNHLANLLDTQEKQARDRVIETITESDSIEKLPSAARQLEELNAFGERYGSPLDEIINKLEDIYRDADSVMAMKGYSQRLGIQDVLDKVNNLRGLLSTRFLYEAADIVEPLDKLASSIYKLIHADSEKNTVGFRNPYLIGNPIPEARRDLFKGRLDLADKIVYTLRSRTAHTFVLYGPRRMGKTSFLLQLPRLLPSEFIPAYFDLQGGGGQTDSQFLYSLASSLYKQTKKFLNNVNSPDLAVFDKQPFIAFNEWLDDLQPRLSGKSIFFTIDEFETIGKAITAGTLTEKVLGHMRHVMQHNENIVLLFAGVHTIDALGPNAASYFISAYPLEISYLTEKDAEELIVNPDPSAGELPKYDDVVIAEIIRLTKCQPYLLQAVCNEALGVANEKSLSQITMTTLSEAVSRALSTSLYFKNVWEESQKDGQNILRSIIKKPVTSFTGKRKLIAEDMLKKRVISIADDGSYAIEIPLVEMWLRNQLS